MASKRLCPFCAAGHACLRIESRRRQSMLHCRLSHQRELICPRFSRFALKMTASSLFGEKRSHGRRETGPKLGILKTPLCAHSPLQICVSHINSIDDIENTRRRVKKAGNGFFYVKRRNDARLEMQIIDLIISTTDILAIKKGNMFSCFKLGTVCYHSH